MQKSHLPQNAVWPVSPIPISCSSDSPSWIKGRMILSSPTVQERWNEISLETLFFLNCSMRGSCNTRQAGQRSAMGRLFVLAVFSLFLQYFRQRLEISKFFSPNVSPNGKFLVFPKVKLAVE